MFLKGAIVFFHSRFTTVIGQEEIRQEREEGERKGRAKKKRQHPLITKRRENKRGGK